MDNTSYIRTEDKEISIEQILHLIDSIAKLRECWMLYFR